MGCRARSELILINKFGFESRERSNQAFHSPITTALIKEPSSSCILIRCSVINDYLEHCHAAPLQRVGVSTSRIVPLTSWKQVPQALERGRGISTTHSLVIGETVRPLDKGRCARQRRGRSSTAISIVIKPPSLLLTFCITLVLTFCINSRRAW